MQCSILGTGAFGIVLAEILVSRNHQVTLWSRDASRARFLMEHRESTHHPGHRLSEDIQITHDLKAAVREQRLVILALPASAVREVLESIIPQLSPNALVINTAKGIDINTYKLMDEVFKELLPTPIMMRRSIFIGGPASPKELLRHLPSSLVIASGDSLSVALLQQELSTEFLRIYTSDDVRGVVLGGALAKHYILAIGIAEGLGLGLNAKVLLIIRGMAEMERLGVMMGAQPLTLAGLAGMGDLLVNSMDPQSRDLQLGISIGRGSSVSEALIHLNGLAEGYLTTRAACELAKKFKVEMPIASAVYQILYEGKKPVQALHELMNLMPTSEPE